MTTQDTAARTSAVIPDRIDRGFARWVRWETFLFLVAIAIFIANSLASPYFLIPYNLSDATYGFIEKAIVAFAMTLLIIAGEIDLSVAGIIAIASTAMGAAAAAGADWWVLVPIGLTVGLACGAVNGFFVAAFDIPSIVVTIGTMSVFRGLAYIVLGDQAYRHYPPDFAWFGRGYVWWVFTVEMVFFVAAAALAIVILHYTQLGRKIYAIGNNPAAAMFSGVRVNRVRFLLFIITGLASGLASILLTSRIGSTRPDMATGWELEVVTMVVLGGVAILGGSGTIPGVIIAAFVMGLVTFGLGLLNVPGIVMSIFIGCLLIAVLALPTLLGRFFTFGPAD